METSVYTKLVDGFAGDPSSLLLALVLVGLGLLIFKLAPLVIKPFQEIADSSRQLSQDVSDMKKDLSILQRDIAVTVVTVGSHDGRLKRLEERS